MRHYRYFLGLALAVSLFAASPLQSEDVPAESIATLRAMTDAAMEAISKDDVPGFVDALAERAGWNEEQRLKNLQKVAESRGLLRGALGPSVDNVEFLKAQVIGRSYLRLIYLEHREGGAIIWRFTLHRPRNEWRMIGMTWDGNIDPLFQDVTAAPTTAASGIESR
ncbi:hypothetical protein [Planctellipticum variicoloris]|uniref:hypothetical protein n=1 Tax=Planctellipticum variicoloris TaxID=3064265 RepID=UPI002B7941CA|nr:hypothetical protein SH412_004500 [Planctomycetaceae bacterium SH412]HTN03996.1 hypothetical protein [Planctomycetaceae bacterium]